MTTPPTPADWYPDPEDPNGLRYWDGTIWTEHRAPIVNPAAPAEPTSAIAPEPEPTSVITPSAPYVEEATTIVSLPDQPTSVIRRSPTESSPTAAEISPIEAAGPPEEQDPKPGVHRAPDGQSESPSEPYAAEPPDEPAPEASPATPSYDAPPAGPSWDAPSATPSWDAPPSAPSWESPPSAPSWDAPPAAASYEAPPAAPGYDPNSPYGAAPSGPPSYPPPGQPYESQGYPPAPGPQYAGSSPGPNKKLVFGILGGAAALVLIAALVLVYFFVIRDDGSTKTASPTTSKTTSSSATTTTSTTTTTTSVEAAPAGQTIGDYLDANDVEKAAAIPGVDGAPLIGLPTPDEWTEATDPEALPEGAYGAIVFNGPGSTPDAAPQVIAYLSKLTGTVDPDLLLALAPNELLSDGDFQSNGPGSRGQLAGYNSAQIAGSEDIEGAPNALAQKTVVIPGADGSTYLLQLNASSPVALQDTLFAALAQIDAETTIG